MKIHESDSCDESSAPVCPICMEELDPSDQNFFPCPCDYQVCPWCLACINEKLAGKCPACRQTYNESLYRYVANDSTTTSTNKARRSQIKKYSKANQTIIKPSVKNVNESNAPSQTITLGKEKVSPDARVIKRNLVYVIGIPGSKINKEELMSLQYFGRYGTIRNFVLSKSRVNSETAEAAPPFFSAFITFSTETEAQDCICDVDGSLLESCLLRAYFGTTKYCTRFLRGQKCTKPGCFYLHSLESKDVSSTKKNPRSAGSIHSTKTRANEKRNILKGNTEKSPVRNEEPEKSEPKFDLKKPQPNSLYRLQLELQQTRCSEFRGATATSFTRNRSKVHPSLFGSEVPSHFLPFLFENKNPSSNQPSPPHHNADHSDSSQKTHQPQSCPKADVQLSGHIFSSVPKPPQAESYITVHYEEPVLIKPMDFPFLENSADGFILKDAGPSVSAESCDPLLEMPLNSLPENHLSFLQDDEACDIHASHLSTSEYPCYPSYPCSDPVFRYPCSMLNEFHSNADYHEKNELGLLNQFYPYLKTSISQDEMNHDRYHSTPYPITDSSLTDPLQTSGLQNGQSPNIISRVKKFYESYWNTSWDSNILPHNIDMNSYHSEELPVAPSHRSLCKTQNMLFFSPKMKKTVSTVSSTSNRNNSWVAFTDPNITTSASKQWQTDMPIQSDNSNVTHWKNASLSSSLNDAEACFNEQFSSFRFPSVQSPGSCL